MSAPTVVIAFFFGGMAGFTIGYYAGTIAALRQARDILDKAIGGEEHP